MAWRTKDKPKTIKVTKEIAERFRTMDPPHDRPLSERRLAIYERMLKSGCFRPVTWATCMCFETGQEYRINGQHTSTLLASVEPLPEFYAVVESYEADTLEDVAKLWATFDSRISTRTNSDINVSFAASIEELKHLPSRFISMMVTAASYDKWQDGYASIPAPERAELLLDNIEFCQWCESLIVGTGNSSRHIARGPVVAAMHATFTKSRRAATDFWTAVRDETGATPDLPDRKLAKWLNSFRVDSGQGATAAKSRRAKQREFYVKSLHSWNAWRKGQSTDMKYYPAAKIPAVA